MKTLMYPIAPEDDFPQMFCAIRPHDGEHQFYAPEGKSASDLLWAMDMEAMEREEAIKTLTGDNVKLRVDNAMLRELVDELLGTARAIAGRHVSSRLDELERRASKLRSEAEG